MHVNIWTTPGAAVCKVSLKVCALGSPCLQTDDSLIDTPAAILNHGTVRRVCSPAAHRTCPLVATLVRIVALPCMLHFAHRFTHLLRSCTSGRVLYSASRLQPPFSQCSPSAGPIQNRRPSVQTYRTVRPFAAECSMKKPSTNRPPSNGLHRLWWYMSFAWVLAPIAAMRGKMTLGAPPSDTPVP